MANKIKSLEIVDGLKFTDGRAQLEAIGVNGNQRKNFDPAKMAELVESVRRQGIINPITVRDAVAGENPNDGSVTLILVAGARRLRAAKEAGLTEVPIRRVLEATKEQCEQLQAIENLQRADLTPVEEARCYQSIAASIPGLFGSEVVEVALRVGKSPTHVRRAIDMLALDPKVLEMVDAGEMPVAIAHQLLRVPEKYRETLAKYATTKQPWAKNFPTVEDVQTQIERSVARDLRHAWFPKDVENYGGDEMPACEKCPFNTGNQDALFAGTKDGSCVNPGCFSKRTSAYVDAIKKQGADRWPGMKFVGIGTRDWNSDHRIGHFAVVDRDDAKIKKLAGEKPEAFGYGILKPRSGEQGKPKLALVVIDPTIFPKKEQPKLEKAAARQDPRENAKEAFVRKFVVVSLAAAARKTLKKKWQDVLIDLASKECRTDVGALFGIEDDMTEKDIHKIVAKLDVGDRVMLAWLAEFSDWGLDHALEKKGIATKPIAARAKKEAAVEFDKRNALRCRVCKCSADLACQVKKPGGESWQTVACAWHDPKSAEPTCNAHPAPKEKPDAKKK